MPSTTPRRGKKSGPDGEKKVKHVLLKRDLKVIWKRLGGEKIAKKLGLSPRTVRGWLAPRGQIPAKHLESLKTFRAQEKSRSPAEKHQQKKERQEQIKQRRSRASKRAWKERRSLEVYENARLRLHITRLELLNNRGEGDLHGRTSIQHLERLKLLASKVAAEGQLSDFEYFMAMAAKMNISDSDARQIWFSPDM